MLIFKMRYPMLHPLEDYIEPIFEEGQLQSQAGLSQKTLHCIRPKRCALPHTEACKPLSFSQSRAPLEGA